MYTRLRHQTPRLQNGYTLTTTALGSIKVEAPREDTDFFAEVWTIYQDENGKEIPNNYPKHTVYQNEMPPELLAAMQEANRLWIEFLHSSGRLEPGTIETIS